MVDGLRHEELVRLEHTARSLRAAARELGLSMIERLVGEYERATIAADAVRARAAADELVEYITHVQVIYRRRNKSGGVLGESRCER